MILHVRYLEKPFGRLAEADVNGRTCLFFEYDPAVLQAGLELSPFHLPLGPRLKSRDGAAPSDQLPGLFEDSLPDAWGQAILFDWFRKRGTPPHQVTPLQQLAYVGDRGMGALTYEPNHGPDPTAEVDLDALQTEAYQAEDNATFTDLLAETGSSVGGAQPKALIGLAVPAGDKPYWTGTRTLPPGYEAWLVKFSGRRGDHPGSDGRVEYAYSLMAAAAGIEMTPTRLLATGRRMHFATRRFDRHGAERIHHHTLARLTQTLGGDLDYETLLRVTAVLTRDHREVVKAFRRAVFNVLARNDDDHGRNHGFLYRAGEWTLSPAYDVTYRRLRARGLAVCGERRQAGAEHLQTLATRADIQPRQAAAIIAGVRAAVGKWKTYADQAEVPPTFRTTIQDALRSGPR